MSMKNRILLLAALTLTVFCAAAGCKKEEENYGSDSQEDSSESQDGSFDENARQAWLKEKKDDEALQEALELVKKVNLQHPTVEDAVTAARCADLPLLEKIKRNGFTQWNDPKIMIAACQTPFADVVRAVHQWGGDVNAKDEEGCTALMIAAGIANNLETVKYLVSKGADVNAKDGLGGGTVLWAAAGAPNNLETVKYLVSKGADVNAKNEYGVTVLMSAAGSYGNNLETVKFLVGKGANVNAKAKYGKTALDYAIEISQSPDKKLLKEFLLSKGAKSGRDLR